MISIGSGWLSEKFDECNVTLHGSENPFVKKRKSGISDSLKTTGINKISFLLPFSNLLGSQTTENLIALFNFDLTTSNRFKKAPQRYTTSPITNQNL